MSSENAQLQLLRYQLNPHFLFNTLNAVNALIANNDNERAQAMIVKLSRFLRYSLDSNPDQKIPLEQEIRALELYIDIEKARFGDRLNFSLSLPATASRALIPSLLLHPLLENAMKYAIESNESGGSISIDAWTDAERLHLQIRDSGTQADLHDEKIRSRDGRGVSLRETADRLKKFYAEHYELELTTAADDSLTSLIVLPLEFV